MSCERPSPRLSRREVWYAAAPYGSMAGREPRGRHWPQAFGDVWAGAPSQAPIGAAIVIRLRIHLE